MTVDYRIDGVNRGAEKREKFIDLYHLKRRQEILKAHPEIRELMRCDPSFKYAALACSLTNILVAYFLRDHPIGFVVFAALTIGPMFNCTLGNAMHEFVHEMAVENNPLANKILNAIVNLGCGLPVVGGFFYSHRYHHSYLGSDLDAKYPSREEAAAYDQTVWGRLKFIFAHPLLPGRRWDAISPETADTPYAVWNRRTIALADMFIFYFWGYKSCLYLLLAYWIHDTVFIQGAKNYADHWVTETESHTNSYYGFVNLFNFNIGYHREHHDFPLVPGRYLPMVNKIAHEFYQDDNFIVHHYFGALWDILIAKPGQGIMKHANKLSPKQVKSK